MSGILFFRIFMGLSPNLIYFILIMYFSPNHAVFAEICLFWPSFMISGKILDYSFHIIMQLIMCSIIMNTFRIIIDELRQLSLNYDNR